VAAWADNTNNSEMIMMVTLRKSEPARYHGANAFAKR
jgi:hypothetical protein